MAKDAKLYNESNLTDTDRWEIAVRYLRYCINLCFYRIMSAQRDGKSRADLIPQMHELSALRAYLMCIQTDDELIKVLYEMERDPELYDLIMLLGYDKR